MKFIINQINKSIDFKNVELIKYWWGEFVRRFECPGVITCNSCPLKCNRKTGLMGKMERMLNSRYVTIKGLRKTFNDIIKCLYMEDFR
ncbi:MAG: hypothetical protein ACTSQ8_17380 [Candidatus Helarchaeota archaeon]